MMTQKICDSLSFPWWPQGKIVLSLNIVWNIEKYNIMKIMKRFFVWSISLASKWKWSIVKNPIKMKLHLNRNIQNDSGLILKDWFAQSYCLLKMYWFILIYKDHSVQNVVIILIIRFYADYNHLSDLYKLICSGCGVGKWWRCFYF